MATGTFNVVLHKIRKATRLMGVQSVGKHIVAAVVLGQMVGEVPGAETLRTFLRVKAGVREQSLALFVVGVKRINCHIVFFL